MKPWNVEVIRFLRDAKRPVRLGELVVHAGHLIPNAQAAATTEMNRSVGQRRRKEAGLPVHRSLKRIVDLSLSDQIALGQRTIIRESLNGFCARGRVKRLDVGEDTFFYDPLVWSPGQPIEAEHSPEEVAS
jgi:hypothetical protein